MDLNDEPEEDELSGSSSEGAFEDREREELNRRKNAKIDAARKRCPIRTRFKPQYEEETKQAQAAFRSRLQPREEAIVVRPEPQLLKRTPSFTKSKSLFFGSSEDLVADAARPKHVVEHDEKISTNERKKLMEGSSVTRMLEASRAWDPETYEKKKRRMSRSKTEHLRSGKVYKAKRALRRAATKVKGEVEVVTEASRNFAKTAVRDLTGEGADRVCYGVVEAMNLGEEDEFVKYGVTARQHRQVMVMRSFKDLQEHCGLLGSQAAYEDFVAHGRFYSCAKAVAEDQLLEKRKHQKEMDEAMAEDQNPAAGLAMTKKEAMKIMRSKNGAADVKDLDEADATIAGQHPQGRHFAGRMHKNAVNLEDVEDLWWSNCHGQASIRRKPAEHEAVFDFSDCRISMPKQLNDTHGGQLVAVKPSLDAEGTKGEVVVHTKAPKRQMNNQAANLDTLLAAGEAETREMFDASVTEKIVPLKTHGHLFSQGVPPTTQRWQEWRETQKQKKQAAREAALKADAAQKLVIAKGKASGHDADDDFRSQASSVGEVHSDAEQQEMSAPVTVRAANQLSSLVDDDLDPGKARMHRRNAVDHFVQEGTPWHSRPPPPREDLRRVMEMLEIVDPAGIAARSHIAAHAPALSARASKRTMTYSPSPRNTSPSPRNTSPSPRRTMKHPTREIRDSTALPRRNRRSTIESTKDLDELAHDPEEPLYSRTFALSTLEGKGRPVELVISVDVHQESEEESSDEEDDGFWQDVIKPIAAEEEASRPFWMSPCIGRCGL